MTATATTTIQGVSVLSRQKKRGADVFELALSPTGIEVRRPGRPVQQMAWTRVSEWEIEERKGYVLLTLRGRGATTPLIVPGWSLDDLEILMRDVTSDAMTYEPDGPGPVGDDGNGRRCRRGRRRRPQPKTSPRRNRPPPRRQRRQLLLRPPPSSHPPRRPRPPHRPAASRARRRPHGPSGVSRPAAALAEVTWKAVVGVALLGALAAAVALVLLQSAGVISWGFLGPVA